MPANEFFYDAANEAVVLRSAIALLLLGDVNALQRCRALLHSIAADEFLVGEHVALWAILRKISDANLEYSPDTVRQIGVGAPEQISEEQLSELENTAELHPNLDFHVSRLRWDATRARTIQGSLTQLVADLKDANVTPDQALGSARSVVRALEGGAGRRFIHRPEALHEAYRAELMKRRDVGDFWPTGFAAMDENMSEGFMPGNTCIITGLSGSGKSTFAAKLAVNLVKQKRRPLVCAWEMGATSTLDIIVTMLTGIPLDNVIKGTYNDADFDRLDRATRWATQKMRFMENAFFSQIADGGGRGKPRRSNERNLDILEGYIAESGCDAVIMDLWDRLLADQSPDGVTEALYRQQNMCKEYNVHGTLLVQLRLKDVEKRADKRPTRESIKGVGTFVEVADLILGVHRDAQFKDVPDDRLEVICLKQRKGRANWAVGFGWAGDRCEISGGESIPYNPGLEATSEYGGLDEPSAIRTRGARSRRGRIGNRDG